MPPESPSTTWSKPFLSHVVAQAERRARRRPRPRPARAARATAPGTRAADRVAAAATGGRTSTRLRERRAAGRCAGSRRRAAAAASRSTSHTSSSSRNWAARAIVSPVWSTTQECPSKTSSSWPPTSPQKATQARFVAGALRRTCARARPLAGVVGGGGDVDDQRRAGERLVAGRRARLPDVLAHRQPDAPLAEVEHGSRLSAALELHFNLPN